MIWRDFFFLSLCCHLKNFYLNFVSNEEIYIIYKIEDIL